MACNGSIVALVTIEGYYIVTTRLSCTWFEISDLMAPFLYPTWWSVAGLRCDLLLTD